MTPAAAGPAGAPEGELVELGAVRGAYGVKGWLRVEPHAAEATVLRAARRWWIRLREQPWQPVDVSAVRRHGGTLLAKWKGWDSPEAADAIRGAAVAVPRSQFPPLPEGEYYWLDLIGLQVVNREGQALGRVRAVRDNGVHAVVDVAGSDGSLLIPLVGAYVDRVDPGAGEMRVDWQADWSS